MKFVEICRCCLSEECFKELFREYFVREQREVYGEMLNDVFNIKISDTEGYRQLICEECIAQLRSAAAFKTQVLKAEQTVLDGLADDVIKIDSIPKEEEVQGDFIEDITREYDNGAPSLSNDGDWQHDDDVNIASLIKSENRKTPLKVPKREKRTRVVMNTNTKRMIKGPEKRKTSERVKSKLKSEDSSRKDKILTTEIPPTSQSQKNLKENTIKLIENSNICLFESSKTKFKCFYCKTQFLDIKDMREHSRTHKNKNFVKLCISRLRGSSYKLVDTSSLNCKICSKPLANLFDLQNHLYQTHKIEFSNTENLLIPFRLENGYICVLCSEKFNSFFSLSIHMNTHYKNNICETCGLSYINRISLRMHVHAMHTEKSCNICSSTFPSYNSKIKHMRKIHNWSDSKRYCLICNKTFRYSYNLIEHRVKEHGLVRERSACGECGKTFLTAQNLKIHTRGVHMKERNYPCSYCGMRFFTTCDQRRHEKTHQDIRSFSCTFCEGKFKSKDSLRRHLKRQHGHLIVENNTQ